MTGTADTEAAEFAQIYGLNVSIIPTNKPMAREDNDDLVFLTHDAKFKALIEEIELLRKKRCANISWHGLCGIIRDSFSFVK
jgi:preprotein translocase subunit SecA